MNYLPDGFFNPKNNIGTAEQLGGKAWNLQRLLQAGVTTAPWIALTEEAFSLEGECLIDDLTDLVRSAGLRGNRFAVRFNRTGLRRFHASLKSQIRRMFRRMPHAAPP